MFKFKKTKQKPQKTCFFAVLNLKNKEGFCVGGWFWKALVVVFFFNDLFLIKFLFHCFFEAEFHFVFFIYLFLYNPAVLELALQTSLA